MSKRALKKYLQELDREALSEQLLDLYDRFGEVKTYYNFVFNPREDDLMREAKERILKEYSPRGRKRPKARRSVAQKYIRQFKLLEVHPSLIADLMAFNLETALEYEKKYNCPIAFYKSMFNAFKEWLGFTQIEGLTSEFKKRKESVFKSISEANWPNSIDFELLIEE